MKDLIYYLKKILKIKRNLNNSTASSDPSIGVASAQDLHVMQLSKKGIDLIADFEGFKSNAYVCPAGIWTLGFGTTVYPNGLKVKQGDTCTIEQAKHYKMQDLRSFEKAVNRVVHVRLSQNQFDALVSLSYNIGAHAFAKSTLVKKLNAGDYMGAANQFELWNKASGKVLPGLINRRKVEKKLFLQ